MFLLTKLSSTSESYNTLQGSDLEFCGRNRPFPSTKLGIMVLVAIKLLSKVQGEISAPPWLLSTALIVSHNL